MNKLEAHRKPIEEFYDEKGEKIVEDFNDLPYATIELMANNRNVFANLNNHDPSKIYYHIHKPNEWLPFLLIPKII